MVQSSSRHQPGLQFIEVWLFPLDEFFWGTAIELELVCNIDFIFSYKIKV